jgi:hypothetical protein
LIPAICAMSALQSHGLKGNLLLDELQHRAVDFFWNESDPHTGFSKDRATNFKTPDDHTVASCAATGFALAAYPIGVERHWLKRGIARGRTVSTLKSLLTLHAGHKGWYYHFIDSKTGKRMWNCELSSIDTSILLGGVLAAERYWKDRQITDLTKRIMGRIDWKWMMTDGGAKPDEGIFCMGWFPDKGFINSRWTGYSEEKMLFLQGYASDPKLNTSGFDKTNREVHTYRGIEFISGGPLFMHEMSESFYSFSNMRDHRGYNYHVASRNAALANRAYCSDNPKGFKDYGPDFWGLSACDTPTGYKALGAPGWIEDDGTITPTSAIAALPFTPKESMEFAEAMYREHHDAFGRYGFSNGVNPTKAWNDPDVIGIDLGMMLCGIENYRTGMIWKLSAASPWIKGGYARMGFKRVAGSDQGPLKS